MKFLFNSADAYLQQSDWRDFALIKFCLFSMGVIAGILLPPKAKKPAIITAAVVFVATYIPLMVKYGKIVVGMLKGTEQTAE
ncbi:permease of phosphate ABC transporter [Colidextribacter sp. OB.20]|uniref:permease of phosphate ABC transporter n=1 Tax=Colidextribacter sp. OB.20 TaxID=2304568 RepID=UPI001371E31E|nr:permease of phosphate ABC transporter [Colidextribacter sp. OB.20]NBI11485.1 permease of phosphate ABC transporter [Colidextribacter sp. OB.20]